MEPEAHKPLTAYGGPAFTAQGLQHRLMLNKQSILHIHGKHSWVGSLKD